MHACSAHVPFGCRAATMDCTRNTLLDRRACPKLNCSTHRKSVNRVGNTNRCSAGPVTTLMRTRNAQATNIAWGFRRAPSCLTVSPFPARRDQRCSYSRPGASSGSQDEHVEPDLEQFREWATQYGTTVQPHVSMLQKYGLCDTFSVPICIEALAA
jgi:hypothetical protein